MGKKAFFYFMNANAVSQGCIDINECVDSRYNTFGVLCCLIYEFFFGSVRSSREADVRSYVRFKFV